MNSFVGAFLVLACLVGISALIEAAGCAILLFIHWLLRRRS